MSDSSDNSSIVLSQSEIDDLLAQVFADMGNAPEETKNGLAAAQGETAAGFRFEDVVVNLAGSDGIRHLKMSFLLTGAEDLVLRCHEAKARLDAVTLAILSTLSSADLEDEATKNQLRDRLLAAYNEVLGGNVAEHLFFSDFLIQ